MPIDLSAWTAPERGALFVVTGASGTGKTTLVKEALRALPDIGWSVSATTRAPRRGEVDGRDYHFVSPERFAELVDAGEMLEWAEVYGNRYGTPASPVREALDAGKSVLLEIDLQGARQVRQAMPDMIGIFVLPPDFSVIERRLRGRATDSEEIIQRRLADAWEQLQGVAEFDFLVVNDNLRSAHDRFQAVMIAELQRVARHRSLVERFVQPG
jgi:guanylate kinase